MIQTPWMTYLAEIKIYRLCFLVLLFGSTLNAEEILLKSGQIVQGRISGQTISEITIITNSGSKSISKKEIIIVKYRPFTEQEKKVHLETIKANHAKIIAQRKTEQEKKEQDRLKKEKEEREKNITDHSKEVQPEESIPSEGELDALDRGKRAEALRELVKAGVMQKPGDEPIEYWDFAWRSLVFPGWGHYKIDRPILGFLYMATSIGLLSKIYDTRRVAVRAQEENIRQAEFNYFLYLQPNLAPIDIRTLFVYNANARAAFDFQVKVDNYHNSLAVFGTFYTIQFLHIIYNAIAWENGLLIVRNNFYEKESAQITPIFSSILQTNTDGRKETFTTLGVNYVY